MTDSDTDGPSADAGSPVEARSESPQNGPLEGIVIEGYNVIRSAVYLQEHEEGEIGPQWKLTPALTDVSDYCVVGDLTIRSRTMFSGVQVVCYVTLPWRHFNPLTEDDWSLADHILEANAATLTHGMYDFAAQAMRVQLAGFVSPHKVPHLTPTYELALASGPRNQDVEAQRGVPGGLNGSSARAS